MVLEQLDIHIQNNEVGPYFTPNTKINTKSIIKLNVRAKTIKLLEETGINVHDLRSDKGLLDTISKQRI